MAEMPRSPFLENEQFPTVSQSFGNVPRARTVRKGIAGVPFGLLALVL